jgi:hypothetical protein
MTKRFYIYVGTCLTCEADFQIEAKQNYGKEHYVECPICADPAVPSVSLMRVAMGKNDENKDYTISVKEPGKRAVSLAKEHSSN